jgi:hypothetical protein
VSAAGNSISVNPTTGERSMKMTDQAAVNTGISILGSAAGGLGEYAKTLDQASKVAGALQAGNGAVLAQAAGAAAFASKAFQAGSIAASLAASTVRYDSEGRSQGMSLKSRHGDMHGESAALSMMSTALTTAYGASTNYGSNVSNAIAGDAFGMALNVGVEYGKQQTWGKDKSGYDALGRPDAGRLGGLMTTVVQNAYKDAGEAAEQNLVMAEADRLAREGQKQQALQILVAMGYVRSREEAERYASRWASPDTEEGPSAEEISAARSHAQAVALEKEKARVREKLMYDVQGQLREWEFRETRERGSIFDPLSSEPVKHISDAERQAKFEEISALYLKPEVIEKMAQAHLAAQVGYQYTSEQLQVGKHVQWNGEDFLITGRTGNDITVVKKGGGGYQLVYENGQLGGRNTLGVETTMNGPVTRSGKSEYMYMKTGDFELAGMAGWGNELTGIDHFMAPALKAFSGLDGGILSNLYKATRFMMLDGEKGFWRGYAYGGAFSQAEEHGWDGGYAKVAEGFAAAASLIPTGGAGLLAKAGLKAGMYAASLAAKGGTLAKVSGSVISAASVMFAYGARAATGLELSGQLQTEVTLAIRAMQKAGHDPQVLLKHLNDIDGITDDILREKVGLAYTARRMVDQGWELMSDNLHYGANHGLDLAFKKGPADALQYAVAEAKYSKGLGALSHDVQGLRQGSWEHIEDRLLQLSTRDADGLRTANELLGAYSSNNLHSFGGFYRGDKLYQLDFHQVQVGRLYNRFRFTGGGATAIP